MTLKHPAGSLPCLRHALTKNEKKIFMNSIAGLCIGPSKSKKNAIPADRYPQAKPNPCAFSSAIASLSLSTSLSLYSGSNNVP